METPATAVILAAGRGLRLAALGTQRPKGFLELGGTTLIAMSLARLADAGVARIVIVTGHCASYYEKLAAGRADIELVHNPRYAESGSMYSLYVARERIRSDFLLLESDIVYERRALEALSTAPSQNTLLVSGPTGSGDEVYVEAEDGRLKGLSKQRNALTGPVIGELVGITRLNTACLEAMCAHAESVFADTLRLEYEQGLVAAARTVPVECLVVSDLVWAEIDDAHHLERVVNTVYPNIAQRDEQARSAFAARPKNPIATGSDE